MKHLSVLLMGIGIAAQSHALLIEEFKNNQVDYVPGPSGGQAPNATNGYVYSYANTGSHAYLSGTAQELTSTLLAAATTYQSPNGLAFDLTLGGTSTDKFAGVGLQFLKPGGTTLTPIYYPIDLSAHTSIIVTYQATRPIILEWQQSDTEDDGAAFFCQLPTKTVEGTHTCLLSAQTDSSLGFKQPYWATDPAVIKVFDAATAVGLKFVIKSGSAGTVILKSIHLDSTDQEWPALSSSVAPSATSSSNTVPSSSSATLVSDLIWEPSMVNQVEFEGVGGGYWYGYASTSPAGTYTPTDFSTISGPLASTLNPGAANGFAAIGFDWFDNGTSTTKGIVDLSEKTSICFSYTSSKAVNVLLKQQNLGDGCAQYVLSLPQMTTAGTAELLLSGFKKEGSWGGTSCTAAKNLTLQTGVHIQNKTLPTASLTISEIGFDGNCGTPTVIVGASSSSTVVSSSSSVAPLSSALTPISSMLALSSSTALPSSSGVQPSSSAVLASSSATTNPLCLTVLPGHSAIWMLEDDNSDGVANYMESLHPCYQGSTMVLGVRPDAKFGFVKISGNEITFRTMLSGPVKLEVFAIDGRFIYKVFQGHAGQGLRTVSWNGGTLPGGIYHFRLVQGKQSRVIRAVVTR